MDSTNNTTEKLPEFIEGIPTGRKQLEERYQQIRSYYQKLWKELQRETGSNYIHNKYLDANVYIIEKESDKKTLREALYNWKSTYAVKHLRTVVEEARPLEDMPLFVPVKNGVQKKNGYKCISNIVSTKLRSRKNKIAQVSQYLPFVWTVPWAILTMQRYNDFLISQHFH